MKAFFTKIIKTISAWSAGQKAIAAIVAVAGVSVLTASGILIYKSVNTEPVAQIEDTEAAVVVAVPDASPVTFTYLLLSLIFTVMVYEEYLSLSNVSFQALSLP